MHALQLKPHVHGQLKKSPASVSVAMHSLWHERQSSTYQHPRSTLNPLEDQAGRRSLFFHCPEFKYVRLPCWSFSSVLPTNHMSIRSRGRHNWKMNVSSDCSLDSCVFPSPLCLLQCLCQRGTLCDSQRALSQLFLRRLRSPRPVLSYQTPCHLLPLWRIITGVVGDLLNTHTAAHIMKSPPQE